MLYESGISAYNGMITLIIFIIINIFVTIVYWLAFRHIEKSAARVRKNNSQLKLIKYKLINGGK
ncbi:hypothetical protein [Companilactobacillus muriivasis]|uniref:hypothetical protein n=1 Tax=Companilactobacillus muriivasis TaxID=3081444 RepID=UPI0030C6E9B7